MQHWWQSAAESVLLSLSVFRYTSCPKTCCFLLPLSSSLLLPLSSRSPSLPVPSLSLPSSLPPQSPISLLSFRPFPRHTLRLGHVASRAMAGPRKPPKGRHEDVRLREKDVSCTNHERSCTSASEMAVKVVCFGFTPDREHGGSTIRNSCIRSNTPTCPGLDCEAASTTNSEVISHVDCTSTDCSCL